VSKKYFVSRRFNFKKISNLKKSGAFDLDVGKLTPPLPRPPNEMPTIITIKKKYESIMMSLLEKSLARENLPPNGAKIVGAGGAGYKILCILDGLADAYIYPAQGVMRWDTCAPEAIFTLTQWLSHRYL
jgi:hypothetical protein